MNRREIREANRDQFDFVHNFEAPTIALKLLLKRNANGRIPGAATGRLEKSSHRLQIGILRNSTSSLYERHQDRQGISLRWGGDGGISRLYDHMAKYEYARLQYYQTFDYQLNV